MTETSNILFGVLVENDHLAGGAGADKALSFRYNEAAAFKRELSKHISQKLKVVKVKATYEIL